MATNEQLPQDPTQIKQKVYDYYRYLSKQKQISKNRIKVLDIHRGISIKD